MKKGTRIVNGQKLMTKQVSWPSVDWKKNLKGSTNLKPGDLVVVEKSGIAIKDAKEDHRGQWCGYSFDLDKGELLVYVGPGTIIARECVEDAVFMHKGVQILLRSKSVRSRVRIVTGQLS